MMLLTQDQLNKLNELENALVKSQSIFQNDNSTREEMMSVLSSVIDRMNDSLPVILPQLAQKLNNLVQLRNALIERAAQHE
jgi:hypothetical protein